MNDSQRFLFTASMGPVQEFIATARRSRDLWFGSWLLSELSKNAALELTNFGDLIFPCATLEDLRPGSDFSVVNKLLAVVYGDVATIGNCISRAIEGRLLSIWRKSIASLPNQLFDKDIGELQVGELIEFYWAAEPLSTSTYSFARKRVERLFRARKSTREFQQVQNAFTGVVTSWGAQIPKSSLDGNRESVLKPELFIESNKHARKLFDVRDGEQLCGIGLLKRKGERDNNPGVFSTSHVASLPFLSRLLVQKKATEVEDFRRGLTNLVGEIGEREAVSSFGGVPERLRHEYFGRFDGRLLYKERLHESFEDQETLSRAKNLVSALLKSSFGDKNKEINPYYCLLLADGDFMGRSIDAQTSMDTHRELSKSLSVFAASVKDIVEGEKMGSLIYAGGDDVLAFVGFHKAIEYAQVLSERFRSALAGFPFEGLNTPTLSVGIAVVHHLEPLEDALLLARQAEREAKSVSGKNALAVIVDKRNGVSRLGKGRWGSFDHRLVKMINWHVAGVLAEGAAYELRDMAYRLDIDRGMSREVSEALLSAQAREAERILSRKQIDDAWNTTGISIKDEILSFMSDIQASINPIENAIAILADELIIAKHFADAISEANPKDC